jgi:hypothetical protein
MPKETVKLISAEGFEFIIDYKAACVSNTIKNMLSSQGGIFVQSSLFPQEMVDHSSAHENQHPVARPCTAVVS